MLSLVVQQPALCFFSLKVARWISHLAFAWTNCLSSTNSLLNKCLEEVKQTHALAVVSGSLRHSVSVSSSLMLAYAAALGSSSTPSLLFHQSFLHRDNAFLWNSLIRAHSIAHAYYDALATYNQMLRTGVRPDKLTFPFVLKPCARVFALEKGMELHSLIFKLGLNGDVFVCNALISLYAVWTPFLRYAHRVFAEMLEPDIVSWNSIMKAFLVNGYFSDVLDCFLELRLTSKLMPNSVSLLTVLPACANLEDEESARQIHAYALKAGLHTQVAVCTALVDMYAKSGNCAASKLVFDQMVVRTVATWNAIIAGFARKCLFQDALLMFRSMVAQRETPDSLTLSSVLPVLVEMRYFNLGKEIHAFIIRRNTDSLIFVANCLIDLYANSGQSKQSSNIFFHMDTRNLVTWNSMVANLAMNGLESEAVDLLTTMQVNGAYPDSITFVNVLPAIARMGFLSHGKEIHAMSIRKGFNLNIFVSNALTDMYAKCHCLTFARNVFDSSLRDEVSYNILVMGYGQSDHYCLESLNLFIEMKLVGLKHGTVSFIGVLSACAKLNMIKQGKEIHGLWVRTCQSHLFVLNSLLTLYTRCGWVDLARNLFNQMPDKDVATWNTMIFGYGMQGKLDAAMDLFEEMSNECVDCDSITYVAVLSACSHGGLVEQGLKYFSYMISQNIKPTNMHYACMVDLLGRAGLLEEAAELIRGLPIEPDENVWGALLGACRVYSNVQLGSWAAKHLLELKPEHCGCYILLSNVYAEAGKWEEATRIRESMEFRGVRKNPGCSWLEPSDPVCAFCSRKQIGWFPQLTGR